MQLHVALNSALHRINILHSLQPAIVHCISVGTSDMSTTRYVSRASRHPQPRAQSLLTPFRDYYANVPLKGTHRIVIHRRHLHAGQAALVEVKRALAYGKVV
ncbi:hypothetical protein EVAR_99012_1 [Eumeta japonica]|uniref:Uncharacterized protein n=1 Tax=Eumeta variegata TaxID=151549 RepID=A0A4C1Y1S2_EUMVA|nr:hypothetical protein EVAR_99012_1 [Eumeta japonica]